MRSPVLAVLLMTSGAMSGRAAAQQVPLQPEPLTVPVEIVLEDLHAAYAKPAAEEVTVRVRPPLGVERVETMTVRTDPGDSRGTRPRRIALDMGPLRVHAAEGKLTAVSTSAPGKYFERSYSGDLTGEVLGALLPPVPLPQLRLMTQDTLTLAAPTPYTPGVVWNEAIAQDTLHPHTMTLTGAGPAGPVTVVAHTNGRLIRLKASVAGPAGDTALELAFREVEPGDPASWAIDVQGRTRVDSLTQLRPEPPKAQGRIQPGQAVPEMSLSRPDLSAWTLYGALAAGGDEGPAHPLALVLFRRAGGPEGAAAMGDARAGLDVLRAIRRGGGDRAEQAPFSAGAAVVIELGEFQKSAWDEAARTWAAGAPDPDPLFTARELMWGSSAAQTIERFAPGAGAVVVVIGPDRVLRGAVTLDGRAGDAAGLETELRAVLGV